MNAFSGIDMAIADSVGQGCLKIYRMPNFVEESFGLNCILLTEPVWRIDVMRCGSNSANIGPPPLQVLNR